MNILTMHKHWRSFLSPLTRDYMRLYKWEWINGKVYSVKSISRSIFNKVLYQVLSSNWMFYYRGFGWALMSTRRKDTSYVDKVNSL